MSQQQPEHPYAQQYREPWATPPQQQVIYQQVVRAPSNGLAVGALIVGIGALFFGLTVPIPIWGLFMLVLAGPLSIVAIILGHMGLSASKRVGVGRGAALTGLIMGYVTVGIIVLTFLFWFASFAIGSATR